MDAKATIDFESRSACSIRASGSWRYSLDSTTEVLCMAYRLPYWDHGQTGLWHPALPQLGIEEVELAGDGALDTLHELFLWIGDGGLVEAHNCFFERGIWTNICVPQLGWPAVGHRQWRCSAAKAAALTLPRSLEEGGKVLSLSVLKDMEGSAVMKKMSKPRKALKSEWDNWGRQHAPCAVCGAQGKVDGVNPDTGRKKKQPCLGCSGRGWLGTRDTLPDMPTLYHESRELFERLFAYCRQDVLAEEAFSESIPDLSDEETEIYLLDQAVNERGFQLDTAAIDTALDLIEGESAELNEELSVLTAGEVTKASQRAKMLRWFAANGLELDDTQADTLDEVLAGDDQSHHLQPDVRRAVELMRALGKSSTAKYEAMRSWANPDGRVRGGLLYHGAGTGRWTGAGVQPHNFPRGDLDKDQKDPDFIWAVLESQDPEFIRYEFGTVMQGLSNGLRGAITAGPGKILYVADFNSIETRGLFWAAGERDGLNIIRRGDDIYNSFASSVYGYPVDRKKAEHATQGMLGKVGILGLGYGMGASKFVATAATYGIELQEDLLCEHIDAEESPWPCQLPSKKHREENHAFKTSTPDLITSVKVVDTYRTKYSSVVKLWRDQEDAAIRAVKSNQYVRAGKFTWHVNKKWAVPFLYCTLPSGRRLAYPQPAIVQRSVPWSDTETRPSLTFMGIETKFGPRQWKRITAYGGMIVENQIQAICRDLMASAMLRFEQGGVYQPVLSVHDEAICEADEGAGDIKEFERIMAEPPKWGPDFPIKAEGWTGRRYRK